MKLLEPPMDADERRQDQIELTEMLRYS